MLAAAPALSFAQARPVLKAGDQKGGLRALLEAADALKGVPYDIQWTEFPAAAPLAEALNAGAVDLGPIGDAPAIFALAAGAALAESAAEARSLERESIAQRIQQRHLGRDIDVNHLSVDVQGDGSRSRGGHLSCPVCSRSVLTSRAATAGAWLPQLLRVKVSASAIWASVSAWRCAGIG